MKLGTELPPYQRDIRWLFWRAKQLGQAAPNGDQATAYAERVAIMIYDAGLSEFHAREAAARGSR
jgi:hypothetical protein